MKPVLATVAILAAVLMASSAFAESEPYTWTISGDSTNPFANTGSFLPGLQTLYVWLACCNLPDPLMDGMSAAEFGLFSTNPANVILAMTPMNGFLNAGSPTEPLLAVGGCPCGPVAAASMLVLSNAPGQICFRASSATGTKGTVDCEPNPSLYAMAWIGFSDDGAAPCTKGVICKEDPTSVEDSSFGKVKALYR